MYLVNGFGFRAAVPSLGLINKIEYVYIRIGFCGKKTANIIIRKASPPKFFDNYNKLNTDSQSKSDNITYIYGNMTFNKFKQNAIMSKKGGNFMKKVKIGVVGGFRGTSMINYCKIADSAEVVAICDNNPDVLSVQKEKCEGLDIAFYDSFDEFLNHDMDAVVLANFANAHAPFAIAAMNRGKHVFSEVLPVQTMKEAVELVETVEKTGKIYAYGENYCYMPAPYAMKEIYKANKIGEFEYGECEYIHNCESIWPDITYGDKDHWRNNLYSTYYCTHSIGPIIHITGLRPVKVTGFEGTQNALNLRIGSKSGLYGIEMITLENGGIIKSIHGHLYKDSIFYSVYGSKGRMECPRETFPAGGTSRVIASYNEYPGGYDTNKVEDYYPRKDADEVCSRFGHDGSDFYCMDNFVKKLLGDPTADTIDVYEALDMFLPGMFAYRSILNGGASMDIPNLRDKSEREKWRNDTACTDPKVAGDMLLPTCVSGTPDIPDGVYEAVRKKYEDNCVNGSDYRKSAFNQGSGKK